MKNHSQFSPWERQNWSFLPQTDLKYGNSYRPRSNNGKIRGAFPEVDSKWQGLGKQCFWVWATALLLPSTVTWSIMPNLSESRILYPRKGLIHLQETVGKASEAPGRWWLQGKMDASAVMVSGGSLYWCSQQWWEVYKYLRRSHSDKWLWT